MTENCVPVKNEKYSFFKTPLMYVFLLFGMTIGDNFGKSKGYGGEINFMFFVGAIAGGILGFFISTGIKWYLCE